MELPLHSMVQLGTSRRGSSAQLRHLAPVQAIQRRKVPGVAEDAPSVCPCGSPWHAGPADGWHVGALALDGCQLGVQLGVLVKLLGGAQSTATAPAHGCRPNLSESDDCFCTDYMFYVCKTRLCFCFPCQVRQLSLEPGGWFSRQACSCADARRQAQCTAAALLKHASRDFVTWAYSQPRET